MIFFDLIRSGDIEAIQQLLVANPELAFQSDHRGFPPIIMASYNEHLAIVKLFLQMGVDINSRDAAGNTALMGVCFKGYLEVADYFIKHGADVNIENANGATALIYACTFGQIEIAKLLLAAGADKTIRDKRGNTAIQHAEFQGIQSLVDLLNT